MSNSTAPKFIIQVAAVISIILTPFNFDALIIPKLTVLFAISLYLLPSVILNFNFYLKDFKLTIVFILATLILVQMVLVMIISKAPFEQEFYGRTGRGLGFATFFGIIIIILCLSISTRLETSILLIKYLSIAGLVSSIYAILQRFNLDIFNWTSKTNGIIGTLGNPNFQSSFTAMALVPAAVYFWGKSLRYLLTTTALLILFGTIYFTQSTQGYIAICASILLFSAIKIFYKSKLFFYFCTIFISVLGVFAVLGMLNNGPLAKYLYKISVQSRGDFWRSAFEASNSNPFFGVGLDSFGDSYLIYRDKVAAQHTFAEMTDNAHNYFLEFASTGGYPLAFLNLLIVLFTLFNFIEIQKKLKKFDAQIVSIFCAWVVFQMQSIISPGSISLIVWNAVISGFFIGLNVNLDSENDISNLKFKNSGFTRKSTSIIFLVLAFLIMYPLINSDRLLKKGVESKDAMLVMSSLNKFPQSSVKYNLFTQELLKSNLPKQALEMGRSAVRFNPNAVSGWALIFVNPEAPLSERLKAKKEILRLDPLNMEVFKYKLDP
jgi:O-antigen ligase